MIERRWFSHKWLLNGLVAVLLLAVGTMGVRLFLTNNAHAAPTPMLKCNGTFKASFDDGQGRGVTLKKKSINTTIDITWTACTGTAASDISSGSTSLSGTLTLACLTTEGNFTDAPMITWNNGNTTTFNEPTNKVVAQTTSASDTSTGGKVTGGTETSIPVGTGVTLSFNGSTDQTGGCSGKGVTAGTGTGTITFA